MNAAGFHNISEPRGLQRLVGQIEDIRVVAPFLGVPQRTHELFAGCVFPWPAPPSPLSHHDGKMRALTINKGLPHEGHPLRQFRIGPPTQLAARSFECASRRGAEIIRLLLRRGIGNGGAAATTSRAMSLRANGGHGREGGRSEWLIQASRNYQRNTFRVDIIKYQSRFSFYAIFQRPVAPREIVLRRSLGNYFCLREESTWKPKGRTLPACPHGALAEVLSRWKREPLFCRRHSIPVASWSMPVTPLSDSSTGISEEPKNPGRD